MPVKHFVPAPKGIEPEFRIDLKAQLIPYNEVTIMLLPDYEPYKMTTAYLWRTLVYKEKIKRYEWEIYRVAEMGDYHLIQVIRTMGKQGIKYERGGYMFEQVLRRKNVGMTGRLNGKSKVVFHGPRFSKLVCP